MLHHDPVLELALLDELEFNAELVIGLDPCCSVPCLRCGCTHYHRDEVSMVCDYCGQTDELESAEDGGGFEELDFDFEGCYVR